MITAKEASALRVHKVDKSPIQRVLDNLHKAIRTAAPNRSYVSEIFRMSDPVRDEVLAELTKLGFTSTAFLVDECDEGDSWYRVEVHWSDTTDM